MPVEWLQRKKETGELEINNEAVSGIVKPQLEAIKTELNSSMDTKFKPMLDFIAEQKEQRAAVDRAAALKQRREDAEIDPTDFITDPESAIDKKLKPLQETVMAQSAIIMRDRTLGKMDYYSSDPVFQAKVDSLIDAQPMQNRSNSAVIMNAYKSVYFDMKEDIKDGKIKSQASLLGNASGGTGGHSGSGSGKFESDSTMSADEKSYASKLGISEKDWMETRKELEYV